MRKKEKQQESDINPVAVQRIVIVMKNQQSKYLKYMLV